MFQANPRLMKDDPSDLNMIKHDQTKSNTYNHLALTIMYTFVSPQNI